MIGKEALFHGRILYVGCFSVWFGLIFGKLQNEVKDPAGMRMRYSFRKSTTFRNDHFW